jgi:RNA polymerase sigma factor (sigma-70 family)
MPELEDIELLREYAEHDSEIAFAKLVERHVNLVYSVALRGVGNAHAAQEISQAVFIILARKAKSFSPKTIFSGWPYQTTRLTAANYLRTEIRQQKREQEAFMQSTLNESESEAWLHIAPILDDAISKLGAKDRDAIVLRFFENKNLSEVGAVLGASEDAAKMRVNRALEKLRKFFAKRGVALTATIIAGAVSANSVHAAPVGLAATISATALKGSALAASTLTLAKGTLKIMAWTKIKLAVIASAGVLLAAGGGTAIYEIHRSSQNSSGTTPATTDGPAEMRINWMVGKKYAMHMQLDQSTEPTSPNQQQPKSEVNVAQDFDISPLKNLDDGGRQLELEFESEAIDVSQDGNKMLSFDSAQNPAQDASSPIGLMLRLMISTRLQYFIDANSKVEKVEGVDKLMNRVSGGNPHQEAMFKQIFGEDSLKQYASLGEWFPNRMVNVGESWPVKKDVASSAGTLTVDMNFIFKNWEQHGDRKCAHIEETAIFRRKAPPMHRAW